MIIEKNFKGYFFLPESPDKTIAGELRYDNEQRIRLELYGSFYDTVDHFKADKSQEAIWGYLFNGEKMSLINCYAVERVINYNGYATTTYNAEVVFKGSHVCDLKENKFTALYAEFDHLYEWLDIDRAEVSLKNGLNSISLNYEKPDNISFRINENTYGEFIFSHKVPSQPDYSLSPSCFLKIAPHQPCNFEDLRSILWDFQTMLSFLIFSKTRITSFSLHSDKDVQILKDKINFNKEIFVFYKQIHTEFQEAKYHKYLLTYKELSIYFEDFISKWCYLSSEISPVIHILFNQMGEFSLFTESTFLGIVQAVEAFHRRNIQRTDELKKTDRERKDEILSQVASKDHVKWLKEKLAYSFEPSLKMRLQELFESVKELLFVDVEETELNKIIRQIVDTRNYYTHYDSKLEEKKADTYRMMIYSKLLRNVLVFNILKSMDLSEGLIKIAVKDSMKFRLK